VVDDEDLVTAAIAGERPAYEALVAAWLPRVRAVVRAQLGDRPEADDAVQEAFVLAWRRLAQLSAPAAFGPWLMAIARNAAISWGRRISRSRLVAFADAGAGPAAAAESAAEPAGDRGLARALARLSPAHREILHLKYEAGLRYEEIAATLGISTAAVEKRLWRARQALLAGLSGDGV
jgi:RNA polymerase sigma-70 factor (ECF subfamily)